jgi:hypothetical protein
MTVLRNIKMRSKSKKSKTSEINNIKVISRATSANKKPYTLKPALKVECMECGENITVLFCPPRQCYSHKNDWE